MLRLANPPVKERSECGGGGRACGPVRADNVVSLRAGKRFRGLQGTNAEIRRNVDGTS